MHHRVEVIAPVAGGVALDLKIVAEVRKYAAAILDIVAVDPNVIVAVRPALFVEDAQTMQQLMHHREFAIPDNDIDVLLSGPVKYASAFHPDIGIVCVTVLNVSMVAAAIVITTVAEIHVGNALQNSHGVEHISSIGSRHVTIELEWHHPIRP